MEGEKTGGPDGGKLAALRDQALRKIGRKLVVHERSIDSAATRARGSDNSCKAAGWCDVRVDPIGFAVAKFQAQPLEQ